ncbi:hypothetical protein ACIA8G_09050 [Lentzea sp. NPDC051213]|uniref:hypothetical protein n=1 Tax=Lentzea sp. NPDC051213 TaxID=3364126 RepID=UPI0037A5D3A7
MSTPQQKKTVRLIAFTFAAIVVVGAVGFGVTYAWQIWRGPTQASKADCDLAQQLLDKVVQVPAEPDKAKALEVEIRNVRYTQFEDPKSSGISTEVGRYIAWRVNTVTKQSPAPTREQYDEVVKNANGHCRGHRVLNIPAYDF